MTLIVTQKVRGMFGTEGKIVDIEKDRKGESQAVIEWNNAKRGTWKTKESIRHLNWLISKNGLEVLQ